MKDKLSEANSIASYVLLVISVFVLSIAGYIGYVLYPRFSLPSVTGIGLFVLAASAGIASFFSPCSFPLLVTLLAREPVTAEAKPSLQIRRALGFSAALSSGAILFHFS